MPCAATHRGGDRTGPVRAAGHRRTTREHGPAGTALLPCPAKGRTRGLAEPYATRHGKAITEAGRVRQSHRFPMTSPFDAEPGGVRKGP